MLKILPRLIPVAVMSVAVVAPATAQAADFTWTAGSGDWSAAANWDAGVPDAADADVFIPHDPAVDGAVAIDVDGDYLINSLQVTAASGFGQAANAGVTLANSGGASSLTIADGGSLAFPTGFNRNNTNLRIDTDLNFTNLSLAAIYANAGNGQGDRGIYFGSGTFTGNTVSVDGTLALDGAGTYDFDTLALGGFANLAFLGSAVDLSGVAVDYSAAPGNTAKRSYLGTNATLASLQLGDDFLAPGTYNSLNAGTATLVGGGTIDLTQWFVFLENEGVPQTSLTVIPEPASLALMGAGGLIAFSRRRSTH